MVVGARHFGGHRRGEARSGTVWRRRAGLRLYRARERGRTVPEELWPWRAKERKQASC